MIVDEVHAVAGTKRGAHLALSLERLDHLLEQPAQRIGLSATVRPVEEVARFLGGAARRRGRAAAVGQDRRARGRRPGRGPRRARPDRPARSAAPRRARNVVRRSGRTSRSASSTWSRPTGRRSCSPTRGGWPSGCARGSTRSHEERVTGEPLPRGRRRSQPAQVMAQSGSAVPRRRSHAELARAHHGSVSKEQRGQIEEALKAGRLPAVVATSQPRARHRHGRGRPRHPGRVAAVGGERPAAGRPGRPPGRRGLARRHLPEVPRRPGADRGRRRADARPAQIEALRYPRNPLDVLAQQVVSMVEHGRVGRRGDVRRGAPRRALRRAPPQRLRVGARHARRALPVRRVRRAAAAAGVGPGRRHPHRPARRAAARRHQRRHHPRPRAVRRLPGRRARSRRVGELDEEMVYESRVGDVFTLGSTSWRIEDITHDQVLVTPAPGQPGRLPFWKGDTLGRPVELGPGPRRVHPRARRPDAGAGPGPGDGRGPGRRGPPTTCWPTSTSSARPPATCPTTAPSSSSGSATSSATGGSRSTRRSAPRCTRRGRWSSRPGCASATASTCRRCTPTTASCCGCRTSSSTERATQPRDRHRDGRGRARRGRAAGHRRGRRVGAVRLPVPRVRGPRPAAAAAQPRPAYAAVAAAAAVRPAAVGGQRLRLVPGRARDDARVPAGRVRRARAWSA